MVSARPSASSELAGEWTSTGVPGSNGHVEEAALVASVVATVLAVVAIWLSFRFYELTSRHSDRIADAGNKVQSGVERISDIIDKLYADMFGMLQQLVIGSRRSRSVEPPEGLHPTVELPDLGAPSPYRLEDHPEDELMLELLRRFGSDNRAVPLSEVMDAANEVGMEWVTPLINLERYGHIYQLRTGSDLTDLAFTTSESVRDSGLKQAIPSQEARVNELRRRVQNLPTRLNE